jgi:hypothetical protein
MMRQHDNSCIDNFLKHVVHLCTCMKWLQIQSCKSFIASNCLQLHYTIFLQIQIRFIQNFHLQKVHSRLNFNLWQHKLISCHGKTFRSWLLVKVCMFASRYEMSIIYRTISFTQSLVHLLWANCQVLQQEILISPYSQDHWVLDFAHHPVS